LTGTYLGETIGTTALLIIIVSKLTVIVQTHTHTRRLSHCRCSRRRQCVRHCRRQLQAAATGGHSSKSSYKCM